MIIFKDVVNYDKILNFLYEENTIITKLLINSYQEYIFNVKNSRSKKNIDKIMGLYIDKGDFYKYVLDNIKIEDVYLPYDKVIKKLNEVYKKYEIDIYIKIKNTRWL